LEGAAPRAAARWNATWFVNTASLKGTGSRIAILASQGCDPVLKRGLLKTQGLNTVAQANSTLGLHSQGCHNN